jgi:biotin carboxyl carrier protein
LAVPLQSADRIAGVIEAAYQAPPGDEQLNAAAAFLEDAGHYFTRYLTWREAFNDPAQQLDFWKRFEGTLRRIYSSVDATEVASHAVNEGRTLIECDRVSIALGWPRRPYIAATSGVSRVSQRSALARSMNMLAAAVAAAGEPLIVARRVSGYPPQLEDLISDFVAAAGTHAAQVIPLLDVKEPLPGAPVRQRTDPGRDVVGVMIIEQLTNTMLSPLQSTRAELFAVHVARALAIVEDQRRILLLPLRRRMGRILFDLFNGRSSWCIAGALAVVAVTALLGFVHTAYEIEAKGRLMPAEQQHIYAPLDGQVVRVFVHSGSRVRAGDRLVELRNDKLSTELLVARNELREKRQLQETLRAQIESFDHRAGNADEIRLRGQLLRLEVELRGAQKRIESIEEQLSSLLVRSPISGTVVTFEVEDTLMRRPVDRGNLLLDVMNVDGGWQLELEIPEKRMEDISAAKADVENLPVKFILGTAPEHNHEALLHELGTTADISERFGLAVRAIATIPPASISDPRVGAEVDAKIGCGRRRLVTVLFGDFFDFVRRKLW